MTKILIASNNPHKVQEYQEILAALPLQITYLPAEGITLDPEETGVTFEENAILKARAFARASGLLTLADDSGLEVDALGGAPGLYSARYSPKPGAKDADRRAYLLENLQGQARPWRAHFHATIAIATPQEDLYFAEGDCPGEIIPGERGTGGFGYDPIFYLTELGKTMAELPSKEKNRLSHRGRAALAAKPILLRLFGG